MREPERIIDVEWEKDPVVSTSYKVDLHVEALDRMNLLRDVVAVLAEEGVNVLNASITTQRDGVVTMHFLIQVSAVSHVDDVILGLYDVDDVFEVRRMYPGEGVGKK